MFITITTISILAITGLIWLLNRILPFKICPICSGVFGTWLWMLIVKFFGYEIDLVILAMLMGGSVVGISYQIEKRLPPSRSTLLWKVFFIPVGFVMIYSVISLAVSPSNQSWWLVFIAITTLLVIMTLRFTEEPRSRVIKGDKVVEELEKKMKNCC